MSLSRDETKIFTWFIWRNFFPRCLPYTFKNQWSSYLLQSSTLLLSKYSTLLQAKPCSIKTVEYGRIQKFMRPCGILTKTETALIFVSIVQKQNLGEKSFPQYKPCTKSIVSSLCRDEIFFFLHINHVIFFCTKQKDTLKNICTVISLIQKQKKKKKKNKNK